MSGVLLVDLGKTALRAELLEDGASVATARCPGTGEVAASDGAARAVDAVAAATRGWPPPVAVAAGLAGLASAPQRAGEIAAGLRDRFGPALRVVLASDMVTWHAGALDGAPGIVLAAGTGTVALGVDATGRSARVDGWGHLLGDDGSGYAIGRAGLAAALRAHDGRPGGSTDLLARVRARLGDPADLPERVYGAANPAGEIAAFSRDVTDAAGGGDPAAAAILTRAATDLADTAAAVRDRLAPDDVHRSSGSVIACPVACGGGLLDAGAALTDPLDAALATRGLTRIRPVGDALRGARLLLEDPAVPHRCLTVPVPAGVAR